MIILKSSQEIDRMRVSCRAVAEILKLLKKSILPGISSLELNAIAEREAAKLGAKTAFKGYGGYPYSLCCSVNNQVVHGMPSQRELISGDIISIDFGLVIDGFYGDAALTIPVGTVSETATKLLKVTEESLYVAIKQAVADNRLSDISHAVQAYVEAQGFSVVRDFVGHGIGRNLHESPQIPNYGPPGRGVKLKPGMVLAIEPMINELKPDVKVLEDGWTAVTVDGGLSAHFEHTVAITQNGPEILTTL
ncbi:methionine aminopeptidase, type I [Geotalea daltonii FRC-32]|uniref:Methionine aminopeptidase n=1 Tax=Geotalea daltonii (strain DSM 22248 / JCM 15807 / FRC-32) TaxID=316067 RepID=B9M6F6_GEODF|nr:type I methionyl aminopeptidase [Geotalea daltonii]ACM21944.1 methionine aminopeptidase, type I [Geotalea daltonii FRC-32]